MTSSEYDIQIPYLQSFVYGTGPNQAVMYAIQQTNPSVLWVFKQVGVMNTNANSLNTTVALFLNGQILAPSAYMTPTYDVSSQTNVLAAAASGEPYIVLQATDVLTISVQGATAGDEIKVTGLYTEVSR